MNTSAPADRRSADASSLAGSARDLTSDICNRATALAEQLLAAAIVGQTDVERADAAKLYRMMNDPAGKAFTFATVDQVFRSTKPTVCARSWRRLLRVLGPPHYPELVDRLLIKASAAATWVMPGLTMRLIAGRMRADSSRVILQGETEPLNRYLESRASEGFRVNLNHLGEAVLGEEEAACRLSAVLSHLANPKVNYVSVKISAIFSQINLIAWDSTLEQIKARLRTLYRAAAGLGKFVNLDMEEYRDLALTVEAFQALLDEPEFKLYSAGIVLQAYLPDSVAVQRELTQWAQRRIADGGAPIKIRIVKGANLAMERVEAELHGWQPATYPTKADTDANFRRMVEYGTVPEHALAVRLGVASHNLFDVALALVLREMNGVESQVEIEMLEGMANHQAREVRNVAGGLLLYAPAVKHDNFLSAMAYLVRRLDENTAADNFLHDMFAMRLGSTQWARQQARFVQGWNDRHTVSAEPRRKTPPIDSAPAEEFQNEPDSDWTQQLIHDHLTRALAPRQPESLPDLPDRARMLDSAVEAQPAWERMIAVDRAAILNRAADIFRVQRFATLACMRKYGKKAIAEADVEVSEAIDFARYYARTGSVPSGLKVRALGVVTVVSPWNFPYAIPAGGILAALMAGNSVIFKPSPATREIAWLLARQLWEAGVPRSVLHFYACDNNIGRALIEDRRVACVVLTGSYATARNFQDWRPGMPLMAETSGKNAVIVTAQADRELAIRDLVRSAFGHAGQKCSAASLAILETEVYDDPIFRRQLRDAAASLPAGTAADSRNVVTPLVLKPGNALRRALTRLDAGEQWLLEPRPIGDDPHAWTPGIKLGVQPGSWFHRTECFGPVLGMMRASSLAEATEWQNGTDYGLTAGLHSLDPDQIAWWREHAMAGNLYINRAITGAVVRRQPFGGWKRSSIGPGAKAGGPNYVHSLCHLSDDDAAEDDYPQAWTSHFNLDHDPSALSAESNVFRYRPCRGVILRLETRDERIIHRAQLAAQITGVPLTISLRDQESDPQFIARVPSLAKRAEFLRTIAPPPDEVLRATNAAALNWINAPVVGRGRIELTRWMREQSVSETRHRYGHLQDALLPRPA